MTWQKYLSITLLLTIIVNVSGKLSKIPKESATVAGLQAAMSASPRIRSASPLRANPALQARFGKQGFVYLAADDVYLCRAGEHLVYHYTNEEKGLTLRRYWTNVCQNCAIKDRCTTGKERRRNRPVATSETTVFPTPDKGFGSA